MNESGQPWIALWSPSEQSDEKIREACFAELKRADTVVKEYLEKEYDPQGRLFKKQCELFLDRLSVEQITMLICYDPQLSELNQIFGFDLKQIRITQENLQEMHHWGKQGQHKISIPAILQTWWKQVKQFPENDRITAIQNLPMDEKYRGYFLDQHNMHVLYDLMIKEFNKNLNAIFQKIRQENAEWLESRKPYAQFLQDKHKEQRRAAENERARQEELNNKQHSQAKIMLLLKQIGLDTTKEHSPQAINAFVRKQLFKYHPDRQGKNKSEKEKVANEERFKAIGGARDELLKELELLHINRTPAFTQ